MSRQIETIETPSRNTKVSTCGMMKLKADDFLVVPVTCHLVSTPMNAFLKARR